jgi:hypothetical protein
MRTALALAATLTAATPLSAQVLLRMTPPTGQVTHYELTTETFVKGGQFAQIVSDTSAPFMRMTAWQTSTVSAASGEEFTTTQVVDSARAAFPAMPQMESMMGQVGDMMKGTTTVTRMTTRGRVLSLDVKLSPGLEQLRAQAAAGGGMGMGGSEGRSNLSSFWLLPPNPVRVGDTWRDSMSVALDSTGPSPSTMAFAGTYTLTRMEGRTAVIGITGTLTTSGGALASPLAFKVTGEVQLDLDAGRATTVTTDMTGSAPSPMGEMPMEVRLTMKAV